MGLCLLKKFRCLLLELINLVFECYQLWLQVLLRKFVYVDHVVVPVFADSAPKANTDIAVLAETHDQLVVVL